MTESHYKTPNSKLAYLSSFIIRVPRWRQLVMSLVFTSCAATGTTDDFAPYRQAVPDTEQFMEMVPVAGGSYSMGSALNPDTSPEHSVEVDDFWIGKFEITWQQYDVFVHRQGNTLTPPNSVNLAALGIVDGLSGATAPYVEMSFGMGKQGFPAVNVTQYAALMYARWLSAKTGVFYRLPTEAEWEYACRGGSSNGADLPPLEQIAILQSNSNGRYAQVGSKIANPLGLHDMLGNVAEWTMDQFDPEFYASSPRNNPWNKPTQLYPRVTRGGSWISPAQDVTCHSRLGSSANWKERDPQIPKSRWWLTNAPFVGFRLVRPRVQPPAEVISTFWLDPIEDYGE